MRFSTLLAVSLPALAAAKELPKDQVKAAKIYDTGIKHMNNIALKEETFARQEAAGAYAAEQYISLDGPMPCVNGKVEAIPGNATYTFKCNNIDLYHFLSHAELGSSEGQGSSSWGWTSPNGREFIAIGQKQGTAFAEISKEGKLVYVGRLPHNSVASLWREIRGYKNYMVIGSEAERHGIQIFDMNKLLTIDPAKPVTFKKTDVTGLFNGLPIGRAHNVVVNEETDFVYAVGAMPRTDKCKAGLIFIDVKDPSNPTSPGCAPQDGYVHDAQCLIYRGPDTKYVGREVCYGYNEDTLTIYDVTDKKAPTVLSITSYEGAAYTHQGWVLDKMNQTYLLLDDEYDEYDKVGPAAPGNPITYIWDISSLEKPKQTGYYKSDAKGIDHNQYVVDGFAFQSNYANGLRVLDVRSISQDPTGKGVKEVGFFDVYPEDDNRAGGGIVDFLGTWSSYAFFKSGYIFINTIERGGYVVKMKDGVRK